MAQSSGMGFGSILKYGAIIAGVYLAWRYGLFQTLGLSFLPAPPAAAPVPTGGGGTTASTAGGTLATTPTVTGGGGAVAAPSQGILTPAQIDDLTKRAAGGDMVAAAQATALGIRYTFEQWNWFRSQQTHTDAPATPGLSQVGTATDYLAYRQAQGLSGVSSLGALPLEAIRFYGWAA